MPTNPITGATITPPRVPLIDPRTGQIDRAWYLFFYNLFNGFGTNTTDLSGIQIQPIVTQAVPEDPTIDQTPAPLMDMTAVLMLQDQISYLQQTPALVDGTATSSAQTPPSTITVTASPFTYQNATLFACSVLVQGGTVSKVEFSRDATTWYDVGTVAGMFDLSTSDRLRVTYTVAPTMTMIPR